jgi:hypothetical protein
MSDFPTNLRAFGFWKKFFLLTLGFLLGLAISGGVAFGMAKPPPTNTGCTPAAGTPNPLRKVQLRHVTTKAFQLPNGSMVDVSADLDSMLVTSTAATANLAPTTQGPTDPCNSHLEVSAAVTTLELDAWEFGVTFGFTPSGALSTVSNIKADAKVKIGTIGMDFAIWECRGTDCSADVATNATHITAGVQVDLEIDFSSVSTGPSLVYNTPLGTALRQIMDQGMSNLSGSPKLPDLPWVANVTQFMAGPGTLLFDVGSHDRIGSNQTFTIYSSIPDSGSCPAYKPAAYVHTTQVDTVSSFAQVDTVLDSTGLKAGDRVMVRAVAP